MLAPPPVILSKLLKKTTYGVYESVVQTPLFNYCTQRSLIGQAPSTLLELNMHVSSFGNENSELPKLDFALKSSSFQVQVTLCLFNYPAPPPNLLGRFHALEKN